MLKVFLYGLASFLETGIGIWFFGEMFPKRKVVEKRHFVAEVVMHTILVWTMILFGNFFYEVNNGKLYTGIAFVLYLAGMLIDIKIKKCSNASAKLAINVIWGIGIVVILTSQYWVSYLSFPMIMIGNLFPVLTLFVFYKCSFIQAYLWCFFYMLFVGLFKALYITSSGALINEYYDEYFYFPRNHTYTEIIYWITICAIMYYLLKFELPKIVMKKILVSYKGLAFFIFIGFWRVLLSLVNYGYGKIERRDLSFCLIVFALTILLLIIVFVKAYGSIIERENQLLNMKNHAVERQYREMKISYEKYRRIFHDEKHLVSYVMECLANGEVEKTMAFLQSVQCKLQKQESKVWTGIQNLDFVLNVKIRIMEENNIRFLHNVVIDKIPLEEFDFVIVMGNLLDNAIEAAQKCRENDRRIELHMKNMNELFVLKIRNSCAERAVQNKQRFITNKSEKELHGLGIESVKDIVNRYNGEVTFLYDDTIFETNIIIGEKEE